MSRALKNTTIVIALSLMMAALIPVLADHSGARSGGSGSVYAEETASETVSETESESAPESEDP